MCHNNPTTDSTFPIDKNNKEYIWCLFFCLPAAGLAQLEDKHLANLFNGLALVVPKKKKKEKYVASNIPNSIS